MKYFIKALHQRFSKATNKKHPAKLKWYREKWLKIQDDSTLKSITINGLTFHYKIRFTMYHTYPEIFVREIYRFQPVSNTPVIIDCGANIGLSVLYFAKHYPNAHIICFEPDEDNFHILETNSKTNFQGNKNIQLNKSAIWIDNGKISFYSDGTEASSVIVKNNNASIITVNAIRLKDILQQYQVVDFLKMDIEGAEYDVMKDCRSELHRVNNLFLEYHGLATETNKLNELIEIVNDAGFCVYITLAADSIKNPFTQKKSEEAFDVQLNIFCYRNVENNS